MKIQFKTTLLVGVAIFGMIMAIQPVLAQKATSDTSKTTTLNVDTTDKTADTKTTENATKPNNEDSQPCANCEPPQQWQGWLIIFSPILLFIICCWYILNKMNRDNFSFATAFSTGQDVVTTTSTAEDKTVTEKREMVGSTSRTIAFFTGVSAIIIAVCLTAFEGYNIISECNATTNYDALWKILTALGIGVVPYGINVWNGNNKEKSSKS